MYRSGVQVSFNYEAPKRLITFLDGRGPTNLSSAPDLDRQPPNKRQKLTQISTPQAIVEEHLTLARMDIQMVFRAKPSKLCPSSSAAEGNESRPVLLERLVESGDGHYSIRITTVDAESLLDDVVRSTITPRSMEVLQRAIKTQSRRQIPLIPSFTLSKTPGFNLDRDGDYDLTFCSFDLCVRISVPDTKDILGRPNLPQDEILATCMPELLPTIPSAWTPRDFYNNVHVPRSDTTPPDLPLTEELQCELYPFQKRAVQWLLEREGAVKAQAHEQEIPYLPHGFRRINDADGKPCFISHYLGLATTDPSFPTRMGSDIRGGLLCEEMGLGKTVEMIALLHLHKLDMSKSVASAENLPKSPATLIITPPAILKQWKNELQEIAPKMRVFIYEGLRVEAGKHDYDELLGRCRHNDVVLTSYNILAKEIHYAETPNRSLRHEKKYEKRLSPLTQTHWWRVVLDEAQMVESGVSNAAKVANVIPREIAWCVSGTPVKKDARDLVGLLHFLRYQPYSHLPLKAWDRLVKFHRVIFQHIFQNLALRHTKEQIANEIIVPPQKRVVITVEFSPIEEQHYSTLFQQMSDECGLKLDGAPLTDDWDPESPAVIEKMRTWLTRLRQTCLHPEVGSRNRRALGGRGPLRTVGDVLEVMIEQNDTARRSEERTLFLSQIRRGQIFEHAEKSEEALKIWLETLAEVQPVVQECREQLKAKRDQLGLSEVDDAEASTAIHTGPHRQKLRAALEIEHMCTFFVANAYFQIKSDENLTQPDTEQYRTLEEKEEAMYETAKLLRKEMLFESQSKADALITKINNRVKTQPFVNIPKIVPTFHYGGVESRLILDRLQRLIAIMDDQAKQLSEWREKTVQLLVIPLVDEEQIDLQGNEYETSTKQQDEVYVYVDALRAIISDRHDILTGQDNLLIDHEMKLAMAQAKEGGGHSPQLLQNLLSVRDQLKPAKDLGSIRGILTELRELKTDLRGKVERGNSRAAAELLIVNDSLKKLHQTSTGQIKPVAGLDREIELFKDTMNSRLEYYRQLQHVSDTVAPYEEELTEEARDATILQKKGFETHLKSRIAMLKSKGRYLVHLRDDALNLETQRLCIICQQPFEIGILTSCGHSYCIDCLRMWWGAHRNCPTCKKHLSRNDFHQITYKPQELSMQEETQPKEKELHVRKNVEEQPAIYSDIRDTILKEIKNIDLDGSFGTKIDTIARHMLWIREHDAGAKSIVFSQYRDFLDVLARAFTQFKIGFTGIDRKDGIQKFKSDPSMECFFLHAKAHSSGLNLVNATHVFLCEPLINTSLEIQAIARVHRIGQHQPTTVWMYLISDTVEKSVYDISVARRMAHMGQAGLMKGTAIGEGDIENKIEAANTLELEQVPLANLLTKGSRGGEMVGKEDLWSCLFRQRIGQSQQVSREAEREIARHLGGRAGESRMRQRENATSTAGE